ncbi:glucosidase II beta subunit-like protein-domain-containing protein [Chaetomium fimeti]|uniref:Endoplasmic reticulum lectin n=1 Tax=Chaetomium fimeti TaxID=1854472 RepID=A0AAE0LR22_9PEZI|nr:glucosidase II beta subunit-like protein-domain-containing protein [Chaetomium fimeti]
MRRLNLVLLASLQLCQARQPSFSVHDDLLAHPQFEVVFADDFISEADALAILESSPAGGATYTADFSQSDVSKVRESAPAEVSGTKSSDGNDDSHGAREDDEDIPIAETYELINSNPWKYLCAVPVIAPPPILNRTATELAKAEEARELSRASAKGWELMGGLDGQCMYFVAGWWSYSFCYGKSVVQYHALPGTKATDPPLRDEKDPEYVLGRAQENAVDTKAVADHSGMDNAAKNVAPPNAHLQVKGDQRYLSQRLEDGTVCDLTGRPRTIEIQYHCSPGATVDRIGWVKEVTTCTYMMVVYTPRLCSDVAFQPPKPTRAHPIRCRQIVSTEEEELAWRYNKVAAASGLLGQKPAQATKHTGTKNLPQNHFVGTTIGGVVVGSRQHIGEEDVYKLALPRGVSRATTPTIEILASREKASSNVEVMSDAELEELNLSPRMIKRGVEEMKAEAGDRGWTLQYVKDGEKVDYYGVFDDDDEAEGKEGTEKQQQGLPDGQKEVRKENTRKGSQKETANGNREGVQKGNQKEEGQKGDQKDQGHKAEADDKKPEAAQPEGKEQEGSQEVFFKEEL